MDYQFFVALTEQVDRLVRQLAAAHPGGFLHDGLDLQHVFARRVYIVASSDAALYRLYAQSRGLAAPAATGFSSDLVYLLARHWFGPEADLAAPSRFRLERMARPLRMLLGRGLTAGGGASSAAHHDILLFANSVRFARFLAPLADRFAKRCGFLVRESDHALREWLTAQDYGVLPFREAGPKLRPMNSLLARFAPGAALEAEEFDAILRQVRPGAVLLPEGNAPEDETMSRVGARLGIPVVCVQQGWSPLVHTGFRNMSFASMMVWGEGFAELLRPGNPGQKFFAAGNFHLEDSAPGARRGVAFFGVGLNGWLGQDDEAQLLRLAAKIAAAMPDVPVYFRPHPRDPIAETLLRPLRELPNVQFNDPGEPLAGLLARVRVGVSIYSSTILESAASGVVPLVFNITTMPHYSPDIAAAGAGIEARNFDEAFAALCRLLASPAETDAFAPALRQFGAQYFPFRGAAALARLTAEVERLMAIPSRV